MMCMMRAEIPFCSEIFERNLKHYEHSKRSLSMKEWIGNETFDTLLLR